MLNSGSFAAQAKANPSRYYRRPGQVIRDRRLSVSEKAAILEAWELEARETSAPAEMSVPSGEPTLLEEVVQARMDLADLSDPTGDTALPRQVLRRARF
jgi:hypothetical protein